MVQRPVRKYPRVPLVTQVTSDNLMSLAISRNVSAGGMFIETDQPLPVGSEIKVRFRLADDDPIILATAEVVYSLQKAGISVRFLEISSADEERIRNCVSASPSTA